MATVINVPEDKRLSSLGRGLGEFFAARREKEEEEEKKRLFIEAISITKEIAKAPGPTTAEQFGSLSAALVGAGQEDQITKFTTMLANLKSEQAKQTTLAVSREAAASIASANPDNAALGTENITLTQQAQAASIQATLKPQAAKKTQREVLVFNDKGEERQVLVPSTLDDAGVTSFVKENHPGFSRTKPKPPAKTGAARQQTETERDILGILTLRKMEVNVGNQAKARNLLRGRKPVNKELAARAGGNIITDQFGNLSKISFDGKEADKNRTLYSIGSSMIDDVLIQGVDQNDAINQIEIEANKIFTTGAWIPSRIVEAGPASVTKFLISRNIEAPEIIRYITDLKVITTDPEAYRRILEINNPDAGLEDIVNLVKQRFPNWVPKEK